MVKHKVLLFKRNKKDFCIFRWNRSRSCPLFIHEMDDMASIKFVRFENKEQNYQEESKYFRNDNIKL